jgi:tetratricopeptide (TPR) repeat protein
MAAMLIKFACKCGKKLQADEKYAGKKAPCPQCGAVITVPLADPSDTTFPVPPLPAVRSAPSTTLTGEDDTYGLAKEPARLDRNDTWNTLPAPLTVTSVPVARRTALVPQSTRFANRARGKGPSLAILGLGSLLLAAVTVGITLWATGFLSKPKGEPREQTVKAQAASSTPDGNRPAGEKAQASQAPSGSTQDDSFQAIYREGQKLLDDGELEQAIATFSKAIKCKQDSAMAYNARGVAYLRQNRLARALSDFSEAIRLDPNQAKFYANRALVYRDQENYGLALADQNKCIELSPNTGEFYKERGTTYYFMEKNVEAESDFAAAKRLNEKMPTGPSDAAVVVSKPANSPGTAANENAHSAVPRTSVSRDTRPGKVRVTVTWEYNKYVGNRADTNAVVILIPKGFNGRVPSTGLDPVVAHITLDGTKKELEQQGVYAGLVGGNGTAVLAGVPGGDYTLIIMSKNTNEWPEISTLMEQRLAKYLDKGDSARLHKVHITDITVVSGEETEYSHDFGNTYL